MGLQGIAGIFLSESRIKRITRITRIFNDLICVTAMTGWSQRKMRKCSSLHYSHINPLIHSSDNQSFKYIFTEEDINKKSLITFRSYYCD